MEITWLDSEYPNRMWISKEDYEDWAEKEEITCKSIGYYLDQNKHYIRIAAGYADKQGGKKSLYIDVLAIPLKAVTSIKKL